MQPSRAPLALLLALIAAACGDAGVQGLGDGGAPPDAGCQANADCPSGEVCGNEGRCAPCFADSDCASGERCEAEACVSDNGCTADGDCATGELCIAAMCQAAPMCDDATPCPEGLVCTEGMCAACRDDFECAMSEVCTAGRCVIGQTCTISSDCPSDLRCSRGLCRAPCQMDEDCGPPMGFFVCDALAGECRQRCTADRQCPAGQFCGQGLCRPAQCQQDGDCAMGERCEGADDGRGRCITVVRCLRNEDCGPGQTCNPNLGECVESTSCRTDRDCGSGRYCDAAGTCQFGLDCRAMSCPAGFECVADTCVPSACRSDADCTAPERCLGGSCTAPSEGATVTQVLILTPSGTVRPSTVLPLVALALDPAGRAVPGLRFEWSSTSTSVASVDASGLATGGPRAGETSVRAAFVASGRRIESSAVTVVNLGAASAGTSVRLTDRETGQPLANVPVAVEAGTNRLEGLTDASGRAQFPGLVAGPITVTAASPAHDYLTVVGATSLDLGLALSPRTVSTASAGISGATDFSSVSTSGALEISIAGTSIPSPLLGFDGSRFFGGDLHQVAIPMVGEVPVPANNTLSVSFMGTNFPLKGTWYAPAQAGLRAVWGFGGRVDLQGSGIGIGDLGNIATAVLPFFQRFDHGVEAARPLLALPTVVDADDVDGDGDRMESRADWSRLPNTRLRPDAQQNLRYQLRVANLPFVSGGNANTLIVLAGVRLPGVGFVPLGVDGQSDDMGNGIVQDFLTRMAAPHSGLEAGRYVVLATAVRVVGQALPERGSSRVLTSARLPRQVDLSAPWLDAPVNAQWSQSTRTATLPAVAGADAYRFVFATEDGRWEVYAPSVSSVVVPAPPTGATDRVVSRVLVDVLDLTPGTTWGDRFDVLRGAPASLDEDVVGFASADVVSAP